MKRFSFFEDVKHTIWYRNRFSVEAETEEEAIKTAEELFKENHVPDDDWEVLHDTAEEIQPVENDGQSTRELFMDDGTFLVSNVEYYYE